ncbi:HotDog domain-containing protein [Lobosporangium transversale]|uniref:HotDog domain-containing protein n=1 Tax=Lobosporangium transversale TaxID=64571 RepID=A0A1Y2GC09_9FUNG|nr:HotDog domain-containing protein [Lobosporangium transversale]ORZ05318.1 HotDog domain-containing protein [Lobosporangium transversale]|eukprot:XP_021877010.1 HotDog domain-containing protein [Lobosporangium transversale]
MTELVLPSHCDGRGFCLGGTVLSWIDIAAGIAAKKHGVYPAVTRSVDAVHFLGPITTQNIVIIQASVNRAWKTSMEVGVRVTTEDLLSAEQRYCCHAYLTFVALPQPPLSTLTSAPSQQQQQQQQGQLQPQDAAALRAALSNSPAARRYSFSLPSAKSSSKNKEDQNQRPIQLPAIEPVTAVEIERYTMAQLRREARLKQSLEAKEEDQLLSDVRDQMRRWNVTQIKNPKLNLPLSEDGSPRIAMRATFAESAQLVLPQHANSLSITFGGQVMKWMENVAAVSASRFSRVPIVTASIDSLQFHRKTMIGDCLTMRSVVTRVFKSSMEIYVFVDSENLVTGKRTFTNEAFFSMVALQPSPSLQPITVPLPRLIAESELEVALSEAGERRRIKRLQQRRELAERELAEREARLLAQPPAVEQPNAMEYIKLHVNITNS